MILRSRIAGYRAALAQQPAPAAPVAQEPVAWVLMHNGNVAYDRDEAIISNVPGDCLDESYEWRPVYPATPATEQPRAWMEKDERAVRELLAAMNRDGGQHQNNVGIAQAARDALAEFYRIRQAMAEQPDTVAVPRELLAEAESIIDSYAEALKASHAPGGDWDGEEAAHDEYEREAGVASKLRALLAGGEA